MEAADGLVFFGAEKSGVCFPVVANTSNFYAKEIHFHTLAPPHPQPLAHTEVQYSDQVL